MNRNKNSPLISTEQDCAKKSAGRSQSSERSGMDELGRPSSVGPEKSIKPGLMNDSELKRMAQSLHIKGASSMNRDELLAAIGQHWHHDSHNDE